MAGCSVAVRPGKPFGLGRIDDVLVCSLPGNPVSALVAFELFVRPALATMLGRSAVRESVAAILTEAFKQRTGRLHLVRAWLDRRGEATVRPLGPHSAGSLGLDGRGERVDRGGPGRRAPGARNGGRDVADAPLLSGLLLAGGGSTRMGRDKTAPDFLFEGSRWLRASRGCSERRATR